MAAAFVIFLREGIEASMIVAILLAYLDRIGQRRHFREVIAGVVVALGLAGGAGVAAYLSLHAYAGTRVQAVFETATYLLAAAVLTFMTFWMRRHARSLAGELRQRADAVLGRSERGGLFLLAFQAVGREGLETVVFTLALAFSVSGRPVLAGGAAGIAVSLGVALATYHYGRRINLGIFFRVVGVLLMVFAAGLLVDAVENLQQLGWLPFLGQRLWSTEAVLAEGSAPGDVLHSFFGYASRPTLLQLLVWAAYLAVVLGTFLRTRRPPERLPGT